MARSGLEVADVFRRYGEAYRQHHGASLSTEQRRVMSAIELCRTAALGGHIEQCNRCDHQRICYNSCRDRHCPKCQSMAKAKWLEDRQSELLPVPYFHLVFTVPRSIAAIAYQNKQPCLSGCHPQPLAVVFGHAHGHSPAWQSSVPTIAPRVPATFSRRRGLRRLPGEGSLERRVCLPPLSAEEYLPIIHLVFANLKTWLNGIHHGVSHQHLQAYLNEFTFRFNKRFYPFNAFRSLLGIAGDVTAPYLRRALLRSLAASYM